MINDDQKYLQAWAGPAGGSWGAGGQVYTAKCHVSKLQERISLLKRSFHDIPLFEVGHNLQAGVED